MPIELIRRTVSQLTWWESAGKPVQPAYCSSPAPLTMIGSLRVPVSKDLRISHGARERCQSRHRAESVHDTGKDRHTLAGGIKRAHVEDVDALHLSDKLQTLETGGLDVVGRDGTGLGTRGDQVLLSLDLCNSSRYLGQFRFLQHRVVWSIQFCDLMGGSSIRVRFIVYGAIVQMTEKLDRVSPLP